jgi:hypothetical protein
MPLSNTTDSENHAIITPLGEQKPAMFEKSRLRRPRRALLKLSPAAPTGAESRSTAS